MPETHTFSIAHIYCRTHSNSPTPTHTPAERRRRRAKDLSTAATCKFPATERFRLVSTAHECIPTTEEDVRRRPGFTPRRQCGLSSIRGESQRAWKWNVSCSPKLSLVSRISCSADAARMQFGKKKETPQNNNKELSQFGGASLFVLHSSPTISLCLPCFCALILLFYEFQAVVITAVTWRQPHSAFIGAGNGSSMPWPIRQMTEFLFDILMLALGEKHSYTCWNNKLYQKNV